VKRVAFNGLGVSVSKESAVGMRPCCSCGKPVSVAFLRTIVYFALSDFSFEGMPHPPVLKHGPRSSVPERGCKYVSYFPFISVAVQAKLLCTHSYLVYEQAPAKAKSKPFF